MSIDAFLDEVERRSDAFTTGWHAGYDAGLAAAEKDMAERWWAEVIRIRRLADPRDDSAARVQAAEIYSRRRAEQQWRRLEAWESVAAQSVTADAIRAGIKPMTAEDLARACGVELKRAR